MAFAKLSAPLLVLALAGAACHNHPPAVAPSPSTAGAPATVPPTPPAPPPPAATAPRSPAAALSEEELFRQKSIDALNAEHPLGDVFFDYDQNVLREDARAELERNAKWLAKWPGTRILVEGHCDKRGTAEYNIALGERRATAVREYLAGLGVSSDRIATRSFGKESPFCDGEGEDCWSKNRRGHFLLTAK